MDFAFGVALFLLGAVSGALIAAAWCSDNRREAMESDPWLR